MIMRWETSEGRGWPGRDPERERFAGGDHLSEHRHRTPLRGTKVVPRPKPDDPDYTDVNYRYAGQTGHIHEVVEIGGRELAKVGFDDRKIVYYYLADLDREEAAPKRTFHDLPEENT
jgi:hypothetical protein